MLAVLVPCFDLELPLVTQLANLLSEFWQAARHAGTKVLALRQVAANMILSSLLRAKTLFVMTQLFSSDARPKHHQS